VLEDASCKLSPAGWGARAIEMSEKYGADSIVAERNFGGDMVASTIENAAHEAGKLVRVKMVTASRGKHIRAEPISALYEQHRVWHVGEFPELENELTSFSTSGWEGEGSPDHSDALIWAVSELMGGDRVVDSESVAKVVEGEIEAWS